MLILLINFYLIKKIINGPFEKVINKLVNQKYNIYLVSDSTGETLDRIFLSIKSQFSNFVYNKKEYSFVRTEQQILKILSDCQIEKNSIILYTIVETKLAKFISRVKN